MEDSYYIDSDVSSGDETDDETKKNFVRNRTKFESVIFLISTSMNFGVIWRFTYVMHKDGGAIFIVPYFVMMILIGLPLCCLDMSLGWCSRLGAVKVWQLTKISSGVGYSLAGIASVVATYTGVIVSWAFFYFFSSFRKHLPWASQGKHYGNNSFTKQVEFNITDRQQSYWPLLNVTETDLTISENFFLQRVVNIPSDLKWQSFSDFKYSLVICLAITWIFTCLILGKGIRAAHKLSFLGTILVVLMLCLTVGTTIRENGYENIKRFLSVKWSELLSVEPWFDAVAQILFSLGPGYGLLITVANNKSYSSNCFTDCYFIVILQGIFSVLLTSVIVIVTGSQSSSFHSPSQHQSDIGYVFILFAAHLARLPGSCFWCAIFFFGMALMGLAANACFVFSIYQWILTINCKWFFRYKKFLVGVTLGIIFFSLGLLLVTSGGYLVLHTIDQRVTEWSASSIAILECLIIGWLYGGKKFISVVEVITNHKSRIPWQLMWKFVIPVIIATILLSKWVNDDHDEIKEVHSVGFVVGRVVADLPLVCIPLYAIVLFFITCVGKNKRIGQLFDPSYSSWIPTSAIIDKQNNCSLSRLNKRHYCESEPILMVRIDDPAFGDIPFGFFYNPNQKNINEILQRLPSLKPQSDSVEDNLKKADTKLCQFKRQEEFNRIVSKSPKNSQNLSIKLDYSSVSGDGSTPMIVAQKIPYPASLTLTSLPSLVILPPHGIWSTEELPKLDQQMMTDECQNPEY